jgi:trehalose 6-phosphate phosphatase
MHPILAGNTLETLASRDVLLAFDFDGTLAPIVDDPAAASMRGTTRRLLAQVARVYPCAVVSGRTEADLGERLAGITVWYAVGNHALREPAELARFEAVAAGFRATLLQALDGVEGITFEDKGISFAVHDRHARDPGAARQEILAAAKRLAGARVVAGKGVVNVAPADAPTKARAVSALIDHLGCDCALYAGDDESDEEVFGAAPRVFGVRIGTVVTSQARFMLADQEEVDDLLERLLRARERPGRTPQAGAHRRQRIA